MWENVNCDLGMRCWAECAPLGKVSENLVRDLSLNIVQRYRKAGGSISQLNSKGLIILKCLISFLFHLAPLMNICKKLNT